MNTTRIATVTVPLSFILTAVSFAANPYIGAWKFNDAKSKMRPEVTRNSTITYAEQGDYLKVTMDGTNSDEKGVINDHTLFIQGLKDGKVMWWGTITISKDGKTRTALLHSIDSHGKKQTVRKVYDRV